MVLIVRKGHLCPDPDPRSTFYTGREGREKRERSVLSGHLTNKDRNMSTQPIATLGSLSNDDDAAVDDA